MPVITFMQDLLGAAKGPYYHKVGRHTERFSRRALKRAVNDSQKRLWVTAGIAAEELVAGFLGLNNKRAGEVCRQRVVKKKLDKQAIPATLRAYLSAIIVASSAYKDEIMQTSKMSEDDFLQAWCWIFEYRPEDMNLFNESLLPAWHKSGLDGLVKSLGKIIENNLFLPDGEPSAKEVEALKGILVEDVSQILRYLKRSQ